MALTVYNSNSDFPACDSSGSVFTLPVETWKLQKQCSSNSVGKSSDLQWKSAYYNEKINFFIRSIANKKMFQTYCSSSIEHILGTTVQNARLQCCIIKFCLGRIS